MKNLKYVMCICLMMLCMAGCSTGGGGNIRPDQENNNSEACAEDNSDWEGEVLPEEENNSTESTTEPETNEKPDVKDTIEDTANEIGWATVNVMIPNTQQNRLNFRAEPSTNAEILETLWPSDYLLAFEEKDGWVHGFAYGQLGWCSAEYLTTGDYSWSNGISTFPLPQFLNKEQQTVFLEALSFYDMMRWHAGDIFPAGPEYEYPLFHQCTHFRGSYNEFENVAQNIFTESYFNGSMFGSEMYDNRNGQIFINEHDGGIIYGATYLDTTYNEVTRTDSYIEFTMNGVYSDMAETWPIVMEKGNDGKWRVAKFATPLQGEMEAPFDY